MVDTGVTGKKVGENARNARVRAGLATEKLNGHEGGRERRICRTCEDRDKAHASQQGRGERDEVRERVAKGRANEEQGRHFAALESCAQGDCREEQLEGPLPRWLLAREGFENCGDAEADVAGGADGQNAQCNDDAAREGTKRRPCDVLFEAMADAIGQPGKRHTGEAKYRSRGSSADDALDCHGRRFAYVVDRVRNLPCVGGQIADEGLRGSKAR